MSNIIKDLSASIASNTAIYHDYLNAHNIALPTHEPAPSPSDSPSLPENITSARDKAAEDSYELHTLLLGPVRSILSAETAQNKLLALQFIIEYKIAEKVPVGEKRTFKQIADECGLDATDTKRFLRMAIADHLFQEPEIGIVAHTSESQALHDQPLLAAWMRLTFQEKWPALMRIVEAVGRWPGSEETLETAYSLAHNTNENVFVFIQKDPIRAQQFSDALKYAHSDHGLHVDFFLDNYDFASIGQGTLVDVGGSTGEISKAIVNRYPEIKCIVQDIPSAVELGRERLDDKLKPKISFMEHDFWQEQPVHDADIYFFGWVFCDWPDKYSVKILQALVPALKKGAKVVINDMVMPPAGTMPLFAERWFRGFDMNVKSLTNSKEREHGDWVELFAKADSRFKFKSLNMPPGAKYGIIVAEWQP